MFVVLMAMNMNKKIPDRNELISIWNFYLRGSYVTALLITQFHTLQ